MAIKLRDGSKVKDARFARLQQFDERSRKYPVRKLVAGKKLRGYTWSCGKVLNQGTEGMCVGASFAQELIARPVVVPDITIRFARENIYWEAQKIDPWAGGSYPDASPTYEGTSVLAGVQVLQKAGYFGSYHWAFSIEELALAVGYCGPAVLGLPWYEGMFDIQPCGFLHIGGEVAGGHAILCNGVDPKRRTFRLHNSWGPGWGVKGEALISWDELDKLLHEDGEACIPTDRKRV
jgi:hypothetical protein